MKIQILNRRGQVEAEFQTHDPDWALEQFERNRVPDGYTWRTAAGHHA